MWDLESIVRNNNEMALNSMMRGFALEEARSPQPEAWSLAILAEKMKAGPPNLAQILQCLEGLDTVREFTNLVRMLLPEYEKKVMSEPRNRRVYRFCYCFAEKYYPLPANLDCGMGDWLTGMPVQLFALSYTTYHELEMRPGYLMLLSLVIYPYEGHPADNEDDSVPFDPRGEPPKKYKPSARDIAWLRDMVASLAIDGQWYAPIGFMIVRKAENTIELKEAVDSPAVKEVIARTILIADKLGIKTVYAKNGRTAIDKMNGARVPLLEAVKKLVGEDLISRIPPAGWHAKDLHKMTDKTKYDGVGVFADWALSKTGCAILDASYDNCDYIEGNSEPIFKWTKHNVDILTKQWPKVKKIRSKMDHIVDWLEQDPINRFGELLNFLLAHQPKTVLAAANYEYDPDEHWIPLEQEEEEYEDEDEREAEFAAER